MKGLGMLRVAVSLLYYRSFRSALHSRTWKFIRCSVAYMAQAVMLKHFYFQYTRYTSIPAQVS